MAKRATAFDRFLATRFLGCTCLRIFGGMGRDEIQFSIMKKTCLHPPASSCTNGILDLWMHGDTIEYLKQNVERTYCTHTAYIIIYNLDIHRTGSALVRESTASHPISTKVDQHNLMGLAANSPQRNVANSLFFQLRTWMSLKFDDFDV